MRSLAKKVIKIINGKPVGYMNENIVYHRSNRVDIKYFHHSIYAIETKGEVNKLEYKVRNIKMHKQHRQRNL